MCVPCLVLIDHEIFLLEHGRTDSQTNKQTRLNAQPTLVATQLARVIISAQKLYPNGKWCNLDNNSSFLVCVGELCSPNSADVLVFQTRCTFRQISCNNLHSAFKRSNWDKRRYGLDILSHTSTLILNARILYRSHKGFTQQKLLNNGELRKQKCWQFSTESHPHGHHVIERVRLPCQSKRRMMHAHRPNRNKNREVSSAQLPSICRWTHTHNHLVSQLSALIWLLLLLVLVSLLLGHITST